MRLCDYHVHTDNSFDCQTPMIAMCERAIQLGVREIAFTDHFNNHMLDLDLGFYDPRRYFEDIEFCRKRFPQLTILAAVEVGEPHRWAKRIRPILEAYPYDIVLGSLHWVGNENVFNKNYFRARTAHQAYHDYFAELVRMIKHGDFDILAHVDLPKRLGQGYYGTFDARAHEADLRAVWQACLERGITPEINTKGLRVPSAQLHPTLEALCWYVEMGGEQITIGSDAHHAESLAQDFTAAYACARAAGIRYLCRYQGRAIVERVLLSAS
jgi:histidinol-phosphatase (PHP family)